MSDQIVESLGKIITTAQQCDAVHIAVAPCVAGERLAPGQAVDLDDSGKAIPSIHGIGIVDPFLEVPVCVEQRFWLFLYPGSITSLRHEWRHPAFDALKASASIRWLEAFAAAHETTYESLIEDIATNVRGSSIDHGGWAGVSIPDELWLHYELATGREVEADCRSSYFNCAC